MRACVVRASVAATVTKITRQGVVRAGDQRLADHIQCAGVMHVKDQSSVGRVDSGLDKVDAFVVSHHLQCPLEESAGRARNGT